jgi:hypothetical protein
LNTKTLGQGIGPGAFPHTASDVVWKAPGVTGKSDVYVPPVTYALPEESTAMPEAEMPAVLVEPCKTALPPNVVE